MKHIANIYKERYCTARIVPIYRICIYHAVLRKIFPAIAWRVLVKSKQIV